MKAALVLLALASFLAGCGARASAPDAGDPHATTLRSEEVAAPGTPCAEAEEEKLGGKAETYAAAAKGRTEAFVRPGGRRLRVFGRLNVNGVPTIFGVLAVVRGRDCEPAWYRVQLPIRPNGATGYVRAGSVDLYGVDERIEVDVSERRIAFFRAGKLVLTVTAAVGSSATPTPTGRYYVNQRLRAADSSGPFGPGGIGISAFSPVLTGWAQGGPIAIHGTNQPWSIGQPVTNGCLRVPNKVLLRLFAATPNGTPVVIKA